MKKKKKVFIITGEDSGDILASGMMKELNKIANVEYVGIGGKLMKKQGLQKSIFLMSDLSVMGLDILKEIPLLLKRINQTVVKIIKENPDIVVTVDSPDFCFRVLKKVRKIDKDIKLVHYVSPSVWAWRERRAKKISKFLNGILLLWPFEKQYYRNIKTFYVGHSATKNIKKLKELKSNKILCLPGSRNKEVDFLFPIFIEVINNLYEKDKSISVVIPVADHVKDKIKNMAKEINAKVELVIKDKELANGKVALCASGTAVFELALKEIPTIAAYKFPKFTACIAKLLVTSQWATLPNIIMQKTVVPEFIQENCKVEKIQKELEKLLYNEKEISKQRKIFSQMKEKLEVGKINPDKVAAQSIKNIL